MIQTSNPRLKEPPQSFCQYAPLQGSDVYGAWLVTS